MADFAADIRAKAEQSQTVSRVMGAMVGLADELQMHALEVTTELTVCRETRAVIINTVIEVPMAEGLPKPALRVDMFEAVAEIAAAQRSESEGQSADMAATGGSPHQGDGPAVAEVRPGAPGQEREGQSELQRDAQPEPMHPERDAATPADAAPAAGRRGGGKPRPWTTADEEWLIEMKLAGMTDAQCAEQLKRTVGATGVKASALRKAGRFEQVPEPKAVEKVAPPAEAAPPFGASVQRTSADDHLDRVASEDWTDEDDLALIEGVTRGHKIAHVAEVIGIDERSAKARFLQLCPDATMDKQVALIDALRRRTDRAA